MTEEEKELVKNGARIIVIFGGVLTCLWIIYYLYDLLWK
jgi:hypothetical protein